MVPPVQASIEVPSKLVLKPANLAAAVDLPMTKTTGFNWLRGYGSVSKPCTPGEHQNSW